MQQTPVTTLVLASGSVYRRRLLERLQLDFEIRSPDIDETPLPGESAERLSRRLSEEKARAISRLMSDALVIGSDQVATARGELLGKPLSHDRACAQLRRCSGNRVEFQTAVSLVRDSALLGQCCVLTQVHFRQLSDEEIRGYVARDNPLDCAGSFRWESLGIGLFERLESEDPTALEGLPLIATCALLRSQGINPLTTAAAPPS